MNNKDIKRLIIRKLSLKKECSIATTNNKYVDNAVISYFNDGLVKYIFWGI